jgi:hypothetical protein
LFFVFAFVSFFYAEDLMTTRLGRVLLGAAGLFWLMRAVEQLIFWKFDKTSAAFFVVFLLGAALFSVPLLWS